MPPVQTLLSLPAHDAALSGIRSYRMLRMTIFASNGISLLLTLAEWIVDLHTTTLPVMLVFLVGFTLLSVLALRHYSREVLAMLLPALVFGLTEYHAWFFPTTYHVINYWYASIPVLVLIISGLRRSLLWVAICIGAIGINSWHLLQTVGPSYPIVVDVVPFFFSGSVFSITVYSAAFLLYFFMKESNKKLNIRNKHIISLNEEAEIKNLRLETYINTIIALSRDSSVINGDIQTLLTKICQSAVANLGISRVSIWDMTANSLERKFLYDEAPSAADEFTRLDRAHFPAYFRALNTYRSVSADFAATHPHTREFAEAYLKPLGIVSMLDATYTLDDQLGGLICCESRHEIKHWTAEDRLFVQALAGLIAVGHNNHQAHSFLTQISLQNQELNLQRTQIEAINLELKAINHTLEQHVIDRTHKLEARNAQLTEYAFINSHMLRAPLARILGAAYLIGQSSKEHPPDPVILDALLRSGEELDQVIRTISGLLYEGKDFTRKEVEEMVYRKLHPEQEQPQD